jgi:3-phenylpropionate/trans-cinnamate dioxygenase ferredoxin subunit
MTTSTNPAPPGFFAVAEVADVPPGWVLRTSAGGRDIALANQDGELYALDNSCTHAGGPLAPNRLNPGCALRCPWHSSVFDVRTGEVVSGPAKKAARAYPVEVHQGRVYVCVDQNARVPGPTAPSQGAVVDG